MPTTEGTFEQKGTGRSFAYRIDYDVVGGTVNYQATVTHGGETVANPSGQFDFERGKLDAREAVISFLQGQVDQVNLGVAPTRP